MNTIATLLLNINWLGVIAGTISYSAFSGIWHKQFAFGKKWENAMGFIRQKNWKESSIYYIIPSIACFTTSTVISIGLNYINASSFTDALVFGTTTGFGFSLPVTFTNAVIPIMKKPLVFASITGLAHLFGIIIATSVIYFISF